VFSDVQVCSRTDATASRLLFNFDSLPRVVHIAAHGAFGETELPARSSDSLRFGDYYRRWDDMGASPLTEFDDRLLRATLMLSRESTANDDPAAGAVLTALELASLNLIGCHLVVLSACETGVGISELGAGVLGFQYAVQSTSARAALVSLWKIPDDETSAFMIDFYREFVQRLSQNRYLRPAYMATVRRRCRKNGQRVHPYHWAAFRFVDAEYSNPMPW
jgi:CHAT domain-containing protein